MIDNNNILSIRIPIDKFEINSDTMNKKIFIYKKIDEVSKVNALVKVNNYSKFLIVIIPSAQSYNHKVFNPIFTKEPWLDSFSNESVVVLSDPALYQATIHATYFISKKESIDYIDEIAIFIKKLAIKTNINEKKIILYGSNMGGFGALMIASKLSGSLIIAEEPLFDLQKHKVQRVINDISQYLLKGESLLSYGKKNSERVNVISRFIFEDYIPPLIIVEKNNNLCNISMYEYKELKNILYSVNKFGSINFVKLENGVSNSLSLTYRTDLIKKAMRIGWASVICNKQKNSLKNRRKEVSFNILKNIYDRIPPFIPRLHEYRDKRYIADGEFAHTGDYGNKGANPFSNNPVTKINGGMKAWSIWHRNGRVDDTLYQTAREVGLSLLNLQDSDGIIPMMYYKTIYYEHKEGWKSGIQLKVLALWARLWSVEKDEVKKLSLYNAIFLMINKYLKPISEGGVLASLEDVDIAYNHLWLPEEYPQSYGNQRHILNGAQFATLSIYDTGKILNNEVLIQWAEKFEEALIVVARNATWNKDGILVTSYGLEFLTGLDKEPKLVNAGYHLTHCVLGAIMYSIFGRQEWIDLTNEWIDSVRNRK